MSSNRKQSGEGPESRSGRRTAARSGATPANPDIARLAAHRLHDPFRVLGPHRRGEHEVILRAWLPQAVRAELVDPPASLARTGEDGLFEWRGSSTALPAPYRLRWFDADRRRRELYDPYQFPPQLTAAELEPFNRGHEPHAYRLLGALPAVRDGIEGVRFAVWAPNAERVSVIGDFNGWDGRCHPMSVRGSTGVWELFIPELPAGVLYKYELLGRDGGALRVKADPFGRQFEQRPATASITTATGTHRWTDDAWIERRARTDWLREPISVYEVHLGSWRRGPSGEFLSYVDAARQLADYVTALGFTHVQLLPVTEHPFDDSWGYQTTGYFAPTRRHGTRDQLREFVETLHRAGLGVLLDWVPGHFPKDDHALARFDGSALFEYRDPQKAEHPDWQTLVFDYSRNEVRSFLYSSAIHWLEEFHFDGLRVDAVASMLYLDYSRKPGEWTPNAFGGNENLEAIAFLKELNVLTHSLCPGTLTIAEESTAWPGVSRPTHSGGLGFTFKWNMGWMHDTLLYMSKNPVHRRFHHNLLTFGPLYAFSENFVLPLSHDEVVHGKGSLLGKMPGDRWQQLANLRLMFTFQWTYPGKKLLFMGDEFAQPGEWNHRHELDWDVARQDAHAGVTALIRDLNRLYREQPALHDGDTDADGFRWLSWQDEDNSVLSYLRRGRGEELLVLLNFTPVPREGYRLGVPRAGAFREIMNSDSRFYGGSDTGNPLPVATEPVASMGYDDSVVVTLPPLGAVVLAPA